MNLESPVKMLLQDVKTPLVPDSKMVTECSTMGSAEGKRKAGLDALSAPDGKKRTTSPGLPESSIPGDNTPLEGSSEADDYVFPILDWDWDWDWLKSPKEIQFLEGEQKVVYDTLAPFDDKALGVALSKYHEAGTYPYYKRFDSIRDQQYYYERRMGKGRRVHVEALLDKEGSVMYSSFKAIN